MRWADVDPGPISIGPISIKHWLADRDHLGVERMAVLFKLIYQNIHTTHYFDTIYTMYRRSCRSRRLRCVPRWCSVRGWLPRRVRQRSRRLPTPRRVRTGGRAGPPGFRSRSGFCRSGRMSSGLPWVWLLRHFRIAPAPRARDVCSDWNRTRTLRLGHALQDPFVRAP